MIIYKLVNNVNGKVYVGQTVKTLEERFTQHKNKANSGVNTRLYNAMRKYGICNFSAYVIESIDETVERPKEYLNEREIFWIDYYNAYGTDGYNSTTGGDTNPMECSYSKNKHDIKMRSDSVRKAISESLKEYRKNNPFTDEHRKKLSQKAMGNHNFGSGDTRSISVYCIDENGNKHTFHSIKEATVWWFDNYRPFGERYVLITLQRKLKLCIEGKLVTTVKWFRNE